MHVRRRNCELKKLISLILAGACLVVGVSNCGLAPPPTGTPTPTPVGPTPKPTSVPPTPTPTVGPPGRISPQEMAQILAREEVPAYDRPDRKARIGILSRPVPRSVTGPPPSYALGDVESFMYENLDTGQVRTIPAELRYVTDHAYMWVEVGAEVDQTAFGQAAERFENEIYPTVRDYFGEEWSPGVDNDPHISILHATDIGDAIGLFGSNDEYTVQVSPTSNQREMIYFNLDVAVIGEDEYLATLAHEFQHLIQWNNEGNEAHWLDEGMSQLAERVAGFGRQVTVWFDFLEQSRIQLNAWVESRADERRHYGAAYLYALYLQERLGDDFVRALTRHPSEGLASVDATLAEQGLDLTVDDLFGDWIVANYLDDPSVGDGRHGYESENLGPICPRQRYTTLPVQETRAVPQYAAEYVEIEGQGEFSIDFKGATEAALIPAEAHSGHSFWWSNRGDEAEMNLTRAFDLSGLEKATLQFWMWYDIQQPAEEFACIAVSTDGGATWDFPSGKQAMAGPFYPCYTGKSGGGDEPQWVMEEMDLSKYVGQEILLRFEYLTETWFNEPGFAVDDIAIPELGYAYDAEDREDAWDGAGFVRTSNVVPQNWALHLITPADGVTVQRLDVAKDGTAHAEVSLADGVRKAVLIIGAMAPATKEEASYELQVTGELAGAPPPAPVEAGVLFRDDFSDVCSGWGTFSDTTLAEAYADGAYILEVKIPQGGAWRQLGQDFTDVVIDVDTTQEVSTVDNGWGVLCRYQDENNYYSFEITNEGLYNISAWVDGQFVALADWTESGAINRGEGTDNSLRVTCNGDLLSLAVNGQTVADVRDGTFATGDIGLTASTYTEAGAKVSFDDLVVRQP